MKTLLVIFTLCGQPVYIVGGDMNGQIAGPLNTIPPQSAVDRIKRILLNPDVKLHERSLEDITGLVCV